MKELVTAASAGQPDAGMPSGGEILAGILRQARAMATAEAGMLYMIHQNELRLVLCQNDRRPLPHDTSERIAAQTPCRPDSLAGFVALTNRIINIPDAGSANGKLPFRLDRDYDLAARYKTVSILAIPIISSSRCAGVLQLINHLAPNGTETAFGPKVAQSVAEYLDLATSEILAAYLEHRQAVASGAPVQAAEEPDEPSLAGEVQQPPSPIPPAAVAPAAQPAAPRPRQSPAVVSCDHAASSSVPVVSSVAAASLRVPMAPVADPSALPLASSVPSPSLVRSLMLMTLGYLAFLIYGSLVPLNFHPMPMLEALEKFHNAPYYEFAGGSRSDWVINLLLFIPLTFLASGWLNRGRGRSVIIAIAMACVGVMLCTAIEFAQVFTSRVPSRNDIIAESISGAVGALLWLVMGPGIAGWLAGAWRHRAAGKRAVHVLLVYTVGYAIYQLQPLDFIYQLNDLYHHFKAGHVVILPFSDIGQMFSAGRAVSSNESVSLGWVAYIIAAKMACFIPVGFMMALVGGRGTRMSKALLGGAAVAAGIEILQVFVESRHASTTDAIFGMAGALLGGWLAGRVGPAAERPIADDPWWKQWGGTAVVMGICAWLTGLVVWEWWPFNFESPADLSSRLATMFGVPFMHQFTMSEASAEALLVRVGMSSIVLTMLVRGLGSGRSGRGAILFTTLVFVALETGQIFLATRTPDSTTIFLAFCGALVGSRFYNFFLRTFIRPA